jgi:hypothetical protein
VHSLKAFQRRLRGKVGGSHNAHSTRAGGEKIQSSVSAKSRLCWRTLFAHPIIYGRSEDETRRAFGDIYLVSNSGELAVPFFGDIDPVFSGRLNDRQVLECRKQEATAATRQTTMTA